jgi:hypothetical protein
VRSIDDPFDGTIGGSPNDTSPADYKLVEMEIICLSLNNFTPVIVTTTSAPKKLETASTNGALFVRVFDADGQPLSGAEVHIENASSSPPITIDDTTNINGILQLVDVPPGVEAYQITVTKTGYSTDRTYPRGDPLNPNPAKPHATVAVQAVTQVSFFVDKTSIINVLSARDNCSAVADVDFSLSGSKLIGTLPDVLKYSQAWSTDAGGIKNLSGMEWDTYSFVLTDAGYAFAGMIPLTPVALSPDSVQDVKIIVQPKDPINYLVTVKDSVTGLPLSGADVKIEKGGASSTMTTGRGFLSQTDWSGGAGQEEFSDMARFFDSDGDIEFSAPAGELRLEQVLGEYRPDGWLESSTFDTGSVSNFYQILWQPLDQSAETGSSSVKFQFASGLSTSTAWSFLGPDGTSGTYYSLSDQNINAVHNGDRYFRYKVFLETASTTYTPNISDVQFIFTSDCVPPGQVLFAGLEFGIYNIDVARAGYQNYNGSINLSSDFHETVVLMMPN